MHKNLFWQAFLLVMLLSSLWYTFLALYHYYQYSRLTAQTEALSTQWSVHEKSDEEFLMEGKYTFVVKGQTVEGSTVLNDRAYRNRWAAEQDLPKYSTRKWTVWYSPSNPQYSSLQKSFPLKESLSAGFLWCLFLYFLGLGFYVSRFKQSN